MFRIPDAPDAPVLGGQRFSIMFQRRPQAISHNPELCRIPVFALVDSADMSILDGMPRVTDLQRS
jgi:hypothetical protein